MKKRILALLAAVCLACTMLAAPASASSANTAVQAAVMLGGVDSGQDAAAPLTRGQLARLLTAFSPYRGSAASAGSLFTDVGGTDEAAPAIRTAVSQGWMSGYSDGSFRPGQAVTLEEACAAALNLLGYDVTELRGSFPDAQLNKARELGLRDGLTAKQGQTLTVAEGAQLLYNALTAPTAEGEVYGSTLGFAVTDGKVDVSSVLLEDVEGPFVAAGDDPLPFAPAAVYRNDQAADDASLKANDVYYYNVNARTLWIYTAKAAGRITAAAPSASAPTSVTVAGAEYTLATSGAAAVISSLNGGGVGQVVTLLLGMDGQAVQVITGAEADQVFYGVVQSASRSLTEVDGADVQQSVTVACTDGVTRTVSVDKSLNFPAGWLVEITVDENGEQVQSLDARTLSGTFRAALGRNQDDTVRTARTVKSRSGSVLHNGEAGDIVHLQARKVGRSHFYTVDQNKRILLVTESRNTTNEKLGIVRTRLTTTLIRDNTGDTACQCRGQVAGGSSQFRRLNR